MNPVRRARMVLLGASAILIAIGIIMIYSASAINAYDRYGDSAYYLKRHLAYLLVGGCLATAAARISCEALRSRAKILLGLCIGLLVLVLIPHIGHSTGGARRWFRLFGFSFQPSEMLKIVMILYLADFLDRRKEAVSDLKRTIGPALIVLGLCCGLIFKQPDFGTAVSVALVALVLFFAAGLKMRYLLMSILCSLPLVILAVAAQPYRMKRLLAFLHPWEDPRGVGFQIIQSFLAFGSGGLFGTGLGRSQQKLFFLPESHTDFIFSIIGEETGFLGTSVVVILFLLVICGGMVIVFRSRTFFTQLFSLGLVSLLALQSTINLGVSTGALPTKGLSLPFISYGGSALLANLVALGLLINLSRRAEAAQDEPDSVVT